MKIKNTPSRKKYIPFAGAFIEIPVKAEWLAVNRHGMVFAVNEQPLQTELFGGVTNILGDPIEIDNGSVLVAWVEGDCPRGSRIISVKDLMAKFL